MRKFDVSIDTRHYYTYTSNPRQAYLQGRTRYLTNYKWHKSIVITISENGTQIDPSAWQRKHK